MSKFRAIIFDMDGTLLDTEFLAKMFWGNAIEYHGLKAEQTFLDGMIGTSSSAVKESFYRQYGEKCSYDDIKEQKLKFELEYYDSNPIPLKNGAHEILAYIKESLSLPIGLATSTERKRTDFRLEKTDIGKYFSYTLCGDEISKPKPDPEIYLRVMKELSVTPDECLIVEDSYTGVSAGIASSAPVVWIKDTVDIPEELQKKVWKRFDNLFELREVL